MGKQRSGFTLIELAITLVLIVVISLVAFVYLGDWRGSSDLTNTSQQIAQLLREAQSNSVSYKDGATWIVYFENDTSTAFYSLTEYHPAGGAFLYSASNVVAEYTLPSTVKYVTSTVAVGSPVYVSFTPLTGAASSTTIGLYDAANTGLTKTISVSAIGVTAVN